MLKIKNQKKKMKMRMKNQKLEMRINNFKKITYSKKNQKTQKAPIGLIKI